VACSTYGGEERCIRLLVEKPEGKRSLGRHTRRWEDTIKMDLKEVGWVGMDWIDVTRQGEVEGTCECSDKSRVP
jgi:hypothetical protein